MKKLILIILLILVTSSCDKYIMSNIYEKRYDNEHLALSDVYQQVNKYELDSLPLSDWISNKVGNDSIIIEQYMIRKIIDIKTEYDFIYTKYIHPTNIQYQFVIRYKGKK